MQPGLSLSNITLVAITCLPQYFTNEYRPVLIFVCVRFASGRCSRGYLENTSAVAITCLGLKITIMNNVTQQNTADMISSDQIDAIIAPPTQTSKLFDTIREITSMNSITLHDALVELRRIRASSDYERPEYESGNHLMELLSVMRKQRAAKIS